MNGFAISLSSPGVIARLDNSRTVNITLTDKGKNFLEKHEKIIFDAVGEYISNLNESELETLSTSLRNLRDILLKL